mmetsp:Transcript_21879/g.49895  ORF Transcript_21879/g.49895 Transcript_21879/m.49895 type:complete len:503 (-) Transcript_21879:12-1520(-)
MDENDADIDDDFEPADSFVGPIPGKVFKTGSQGLGYYTDLYAPPPEEEEGQQDQKAEPTDPAASFALGDYVQVHGLESEGGQRLNGNFGIIAKSVPERERFEVRFSRHTVVSLRPANLRLADAEWARGDQARLVRLHDPRAEPELKALNSCLGRLLKRADARNTWVVEVHGKEREVRCQHLRVCSKEVEAYWRELALDSGSQFFLALAVLLTIAVLVESQLAVWNLTQLRVGPIGAQAPGDRLAWLGLAAVVVSLSWFCGVLYACYQMHASLKDPEVTFPQISELGVGPFVSKALYRIGFTAVAAVLAAMNLVHAELSLPHLPGGRHSFHGSEMIMYGMMAASGVALQGICLLQPNLSMQTMLHGVGAMLFFYGTWCHMGTAEKLYLPTMPKAHDTIETDEAALLAAAAESSALLKHPVVALLVHVRHKFLMRAPAVLFVLPVLAQLSDRMKITASAVVSPSMRSTLGLVQWLLVSDFVLIFISYGLEIMAAAHIIMPQSDL